MKKLYLQTLLCLILSKDSEIWKACTVAPSIVRILQFLTTYMQVYLFFLLSLKKGPVKFAKVCDRALPDITSGPEVREIFKIRTARKPENFLPGRWTFKIAKNPKNCQFFFQDFFLFIYLVQELLTPNLCPGTLSYENLRLKM